MKKYITTLEELTALKFTGTKIYDEAKSGYYKFVDDELCWYGTSNFKYNTSLEFVKNVKRFYIEIEDKIDHIEIEDKIHHTDCGKLCIFWNDESELREECIGILTDILGISGILYECNFNPKPYKHCCRATKEKIEKYL